MNDEEFSRASCRRIARERARQSDRGVPKDSLISYVVWQISGIHQRSRKNQMFLEKLAILQRELKALQCWLGKLKNKKNFFAREISTWEFEVILTSIHSQEPAVTCDVSDVEHKFFWGNPSENSWKTYLRCPAVNLIFEFLAIDFGCLYPILYVNFSCSSCRKIS